MLSELTRSDEGSRLVVGGRLTASVAGRLRDALLEALRDAPRLELVVRDVEEVDLTFVQLLCAAHRSVASRAVPFSVSGLDACAPVRRLIREGGFARADGCPDGCVLACADAGRGAGG